MKTPHRVTLIPGDGIGPEVTQAAMLVVAAAGVDVAWDRQLAGAASVAAGGAPVPTTAAVTQAIARALNP